MPRAGGVPDVIEGTMNRVAQSAADVAGTTRGSHRHLQFGIAAMMSVNPWARVARQMARDVGEHLPAVSRALRVGGWLPAQCL